MHKTEEEAIEAARKALNDDDNFVEFDGHNCNEAEDNWCPGWDGESPRCSCGNRRVYWDTVDDGAGGYIAVARAN
jgi:hypothetical protein